MNESSVDVECQIYTSQIIIVFKLSQIVLHTTRITALIKLQTGLQRNQLYRGKDSVSRLTILNVWPLLL